MSESSDVVPAPNLVAITRAYAKIIDDVNGIDLEDLRPVEGRWSATRSARQ
jgi:hypothetical protein